MKLIGLSISRCVQDVLDGKVALEDIAYISAGTRVPTRAAWQTVIDGYCTKKRGFFSGGWGTDEDPFLGWGEERKEQATAIINTLLDGDRIHQPRLYGNPPVVALRAHRGREQYIPATYKGAPLKEWWTTALTDEESYAKLGNETRPEG